MQSRAEQWLRLCWLGHRNVAAGPQEVETPPKQAEALKWHRAEELSLSTTHMTRFTHF